MKALVTGAAGYIGSHVLVALGDAGFDLVGVDSLVRGHLEAVRRVEALIGREVPLEVGDLCDAAFLDDVFARHTADVVLHIAAYKSAPESVAHPDWYVRNNVEATATLAAAMQRAGVRRVVYASSGAVYGEPDSARIGEDAAPAPVSPYGATKLEGEVVLNAAGLDVASLRFFNVCGAHPSARLGELGEASPNLFPVVLRRLGDPAPAVEVYGTDWPTRDGTCVRDYVHVCDVAAANVAAARHLLARGGQHVWNVGTGTGSTVLEVIAAIGAAAGVRIAAIPAPRRPGDPAAVVAAVDRSRDALGFVATRSLRDMAESAVGWARRA